jgi:hypothetical protein
METLKDIFAKRFIGLKSPFDYETCKYEDIKSKSIIHQGHLQYLYSTNILGDSLCKFDFSVFFFLKDKSLNVLVQTYLVVLTRIMQDMIGLYLFVDEKKPSSYCFLINQQTK